jgi:tripartite-type tricarboxylate transporter receptor subunit TctC
MRAATPVLSAQIGQPVVLENRTGANGIVATEACIRAAPDGYTACVVSANTVSFNPNVFSKLPYDPGKDLRPVSRLMFLNSALTVNTSLGVSTVKEFQDFAVAKPGALNFGTLGAGTQTDVFRQYLVERWKTELVGIPYKSGNLIVAALVAGEIHAGMFGLGSVAGQLKAGKARLLAVGAERRQKQFPDVPTLKEFNLDEGNSRVFWGAMVTAATPDVVVSRLNGEIVKALNDPKLVEFLESRFLEPAPTSVEEFGAFLAADRAHVAQLVKKYKVPVQ